MSDIGNKKVFAANLKKYMDLKHIDRNKLCFDLGFKYSTVSEWLSAKKYPRIDKIEAMSIYFGIQKSDLIEGSKPFAGVDLSSFDNIHPITKKRFPMLGKIACGEPIFADEDHETYIEASDNIQADFCLTAKGDSMIGARIQDGDIVFIREQPMVNNGQIAAVIINDEATLKRWYYYPNQSKLVLTPENPAYEPLVYIGEELNTIRCLGLAVAFMSNL